MPRAKEGGVRRETVITATITGIRRGKRVTERRRADSKAHAAKLIEKVSKTLETVEATDTVVEHGKWIARVTFNDPITGKRKTKKKAAETKTEAKLELKALIRQIDEEGVESLSSNMTFDALAKYFLKQYVQEADIRDGKKLSGMKSWETAEYRVQDAQKYFGSKKIRTIRYDDIRAYRQSLLDRKTMHGKTRSVADVNRQLAVLRRMFNIAVRQGFLPKNPMLVGGESLIVAGHESPRSRVLSAKEEQKLLAQCNTPSRLYMRAVLYFLIDTGMRKGELRSLKFSDISLPDRVIKIRQGNTKTEKAREVPISDRLAVEVERLYKLRGENPDALVIGVDFKKMFARIVKDAEVADIRVHDLRATFATRMNRVMNATEVSKLLGHAKVDTSYRHYIAADDETQKRAVAALNSINEANLKT